MSYCAVVIIGFRNKDDIVGCLEHLSQTREPEHAVHICENGGSAAFDTMVSALLEMGGEIAYDPATPHPATIIRTRVIRLNANGVLVYVHEASGNIGYAGGINAVLDYIKPDPNWDSVWVLNPDTEPAPDALIALKRRAEAGGYGIVGSRIVLMHNNKIQMYGGRWRAWMARGYNIGLGADRDAMPDVSAVESEMDYVCGASMYIIRPFIEKVGNMDESYFLYAEEVDWCMRRGDFKLGYAHDSIVRHSHGATIGSNHSRKDRSSFSVYLDERSKLLLTRRFYPTAFPLIVLSTLILTTQYAKQGAWKNFGVALQGWLSGVRGETGFPPRFLPKGAKRG